MMQINTDSALMAASSGGVLLSAGTEILAQAPSGGIITLLTLFLQAFIVYRQSRNERRKNEKLKRDEVRQVVSEMLNDQKNDSNDK